jgi:hypothetical protein
VFEIYTRKILNAVNINGASYEAPVYGQTIALPLIFPCLERAGKEFCLKAAGKTARRFAGRGYDR